MMINEYGFDYDKYVINVPVPFKKDFRIDVIVRAFNDAKTVEFFDEKSYRDAKNLYLKEVMRVHNLFVNDLFEYAGIKTNPKRTKLLDKVLEQFGDEKEMIWKMVCEWSELIKD